MPTPHTDLLIVKFCQEMRPHLLLLIIAFFPFSVLQAQYEPIRRNTLFFEAGGNGFLYSLNFDRILSSGTNGRLCGRSGFMYLPGLPNNARRHMVGVPLELTYCKGRETHFLELGLGVTGIYDSYGGRYAEGILLAVARIGYRHQKREGGLFYKAGFTPMYGTIYPLKVGYRGPYDERIILPMVGLAVGYTLKAGA